MQNENSVTTETPVSKKPIEQIELSDSPYCQKNCKVCNSSFRQLILEMIQQGKPYRDISAFLKEKHNESISIA